MEQAIIAMLANKQTPYESPTLAMFASLCCDVLQLPSGKGKAICTITTPMTSKLYRARGEGELLDRSIHQTTGRNAPSPHSLEYTCTKLAFKIFIFVISLEAKA